jgi:glutamine synthetase
VAFRRGSRASFTPIPTPHGVSNGTHIHWSFLDPAGRPVLHAPAMPWGMSDTGRHFCAGILHHLPALCAVTAPSVASYYRLRPNHWAPVHADIGDIDRGTSIRICPLPAGDAERRARAYNLEFRVADATASPYLALAVLVQAGLDGVREHREIDPKTAPPLPQSLGAALTLLERTPAAADWLGAEVLAAYLQFKRAEIAGLEPLDETEICRRYAEAY